MVEYKVIIYKESLMASRMFGNSVVKADKFAKMLNDEARNNWRVVTVEKEIRKTAFSKREAFVIVLERKVS